MKSGQDNKYDITKASGLKCAGLVFSTLFSQNLSNCCRNKLMKFPFDKIWPRQNINFIRNKYQWPERIYDPITAMGFSAMFTFQLDNTNR